MNAKQVVLKQDNGYLMWKYDDENSNWKNLYNLTDLRGKDGLNGKDGTDGKDGVNGKNGLNGKDGADGRNGIDGKDGVDGKDGREVEFRVSGNIIQWKYTNQSDELWNDLFDLNTLNSGN